MFIPAGMSFEEPEETPDILNGISMALTKVSWGGEANAIWRAILQKRLYEAKIITREQAELDEHVALLLRKL